ncbi:MAG: riboflavin biosynthesis protein RibD, partial [Pseudomonadota bacterium]|nr:riboflavin biosynthesis protein RibD [Pseudomonadota bacterium]
MTAAIALGAAVRGRTAPNPNVGCVIVSDGELVGRGATSP